VPQQFYVDVDPANIGSCLRFSMLLPSPSQVSYSTSAVATLRTTLDIPVGYSTYDPADYSCTAGGSGGPLACSFIIPAGDVYVGRYYIWADAPRATEIIVEQFDPVIPVLNLNQNNYATVNGPSPTVTNGFDLPFRPPVQFYRFDVDTYDPKFFARVTVTGVSQGELAVVVNSGFEPYSSSGYFDFVDSVSCQHVDADTPCTIDIERGDLEFVSAYEGDDLGDDDDDGYPLPSTFFITIVGNQQTCELHSSSTTCACRPTGC
jgi:hypothetical protein